MLHDCSLTQEPHTLPPLPPPPNLPHFISACAQTCKQTSVEGVYTSPKCIRCIQQLIKISANTFLMVRIKHTQQCIYEQMRERGALHYGLMLRLGLYYRCVVSSILIGETIFVTDEDKLSKYRCLSENVLSQEKPKFWYPILEWYRLFCLKNIFVLQMNLKLKEYLNILLYVSNI